MELKHDSGSPEANGGGVEILSLEEISLRLDAARHLIAEMEERLAGALEPCSIGDKRELRAAMKPFGPEALDLLITLLSSDDLKKQLVGLKGIAALGEQGARGAEAVAALLKPGDESIRRNAAQVLGDIGAGVGPKPVNSLVEALRDKDPWLRYYAVISIGKIGMAAGDVAEEITALLSDPSPAVQKAAEQALTKMSAALHRSLSRSGKRKSS